MVRTRHITKILPLALFLVVAVTLLPERSYADDRTRLPAMKAGYLFNFLRYSEWPGATAGAPLRVASFEGNPVNAILKKIDGRKLRGRTIEVVQIPAAAPYALEGLDLLFVGKQMDGQLPHLFDAPMPGSLITVGESAAFQRTNGALYFWVDESSLRFCVQNPPKDTRFSARLMRLSRCRK